ncbi:MAG: very short patch repair endonuclease [Methylobacter sp.]
MNQARHNRNRNDVLTPEQRSRCMSNIKGKNTQPELQLRKALWAKGLRYRVHAALIGRPDIVFPKQRLAIFVDGCFWHGCPIHGTKPVTHADFWENKIKGNLERDRRVTSQLTELGWIVIRIWAHEIKECLDKVTNNIIKLLRTSDTKVEKGPT